MRCGAKPEVTAMATRHVAVIFVMQLRLVFSRVACLAPKT